MLVVYEMFKNVNCVSWVEKVFILGFMVGVRGKEIMDYLLLL